MRARNGFKVDFHWENYQLKDAIITSLNGNDCSVVLPAGKSIFHDNILLIKKDNTSKVVTFKTEKGKQYKIY